MLKIIKSVASLFSGGYVIAENENGLKIKIWDAGGIEVLNPEKYFQSESYRRFIESKNQSRTSSRDTEGNRELDHRYL